MLATTESIAIVGTEARLVQVEVHSDSSGLPGFTIVGLPTKSVREAEQRTRAAISSSGHRWESRKIVANLAPGGLRKDGSHFDLPIALGILAAQEQLNLDGFKRWVCMGELALDGRLRPVRGTLAAAIAARRAGRAGIMCPAANAPEAALVEGIDVAAVETLNQCIGFVRGEWTPPSVEARSLESVDAWEDMAEVRGHEGAKRAAEIAAAGGHNLMLIGPPGSGKTMLARRMSGILPEMSVDESLDVTRIHSVAGLLTERAGLIRSRPFRTPHHNISVAGLVGGGAGLARPGEVSLAHHGTLFLDELTLYRRDVLESLRAPLEDGVVRIARSGGVLSYPCRFSLVAAMNPCPCGYLGDRRACRCLEHDLRRYRARLSGPLLDRFDIQVTMARLDRSELVSDSRGERSVAIRARIERARACQRERYGVATVTNSSCTKGQLDRATALAPEARAALERAVDTLYLSGRGVDRSLRVARTIADLEGGAQVGLDHLAEALSLRAGEVGEWAVA